MTPTEKQKLISEQAVYGDLQVKDMNFPAIIHETVEMAGFRDEVFIVNTVSEENCVVTEAIKPILRPLSDLTKEITHAGYNENQPFIPLVELAKINFLISPKSNNDYILQNGDNGRGYGVYFNYKPYRERERCFFLQVYRDGALQAFSTDVKSHSDKSNTARHCGVKAKEILNLLYLWHFDTRNLIEKSEAISTDEVNPYEV